jgi:TIR domain
MEELRYFFSYARKESEFVLKRAKELRAVGANLWLDRLDILGGQRWDRAVERALETCQGMIAVLSSEALASNNVMDEVSYALEKEKLVVPILLRPCDIPFRLRRVQHIDFTAGYDIGFSQLLRALCIDQPSQQPGSAAREEPVVHDIRQKISDTTLQGQLETKQPNARKPLSTLSPTGKAILFYLALLILILGLALISSL